MRRQSRASGKVNSTTPMAFLAHLLREELGCLAIIRDEVAMYRVPIIPKCFMHGTTPRIHGVHLPAYTPALNRGAGL